MHTDFFDAIKIRVLDCQNSYIKNENDILKNILDKIANAKRKQDRDLALFRLKNCIEKRDIKIYRMGFYDGEKGEGALIKYYHDWLEREKQGKEPFDFSNWYGTDEDI